MITLSPAPIAPSPSTGSMVVTDDGGKPDPASETFAALLGALGATATGGSAKPAHTPHNGLPKGGKDLPDDAELAGDSAQPVEPQTIETHDPAVQTLTPPILLALPAPQPVMVAAGPTLPKETVPQAAQLVSKGVAAPIEQNVLAALTSPITEHPAVAAGPVTPVSAAAAQGLAVRHQLEPDTPRQAFKPALTVSAHAALRAINGPAATQSGSPVVPPTLPDQAAARASAALAARGNSGHRANTPQLNVSAATAVAASTAGQTDALALKASLRSLETRTAQRASSFESQTPTTLPIIEGDPLAGLEASAAAAPAAVPATARFDFAAVIDRLIEARELAVTQPSAMTVEHDDFGSVSLRFHAGDDGLTVTMAGADPDFARAVTAAVAPGTAANQGDPTRHGDTPRQGNDPASARQHGGSGAAGDDPRSGSRSGEGSGHSRQRGEPGRSHNLAAGQPARGGIFA